MKDFFKKLLDGNDNSVSSRRFTMLYGMVMFLAAFIIIACGIVLPEYLVNSTIWLIGIGAGAVAVNEIQKKIFKRNGK